MRTGYMGSCTLMMSSGGTRRSGGRASAAGPPGGRPPPPARPHGRRVRQPDVPRDVADFEVEGVDIDAQQPARPRHCDTWLCPKATLPE